MSVTLEASSPHLLIGDDDLFCVDRRGHEFTAANAYVDKRGRRQCKTCKVQRQRDARASARIGVAA